VCLADICHKGTSDETNFFLPCVCSFLLYAEVLFVPPGEHALAKCLHSFASTGRMTFVSARHGEVQGGPCAAKHHQYSHSRSSTYEQHDAYTPSERMSGAHQMRGGFYDAPTDITYADGWRGFPQRRNLWVDTRTSSSTHSAARAYSSSTGASSAGVRRITPTRTRSSELASISVSGHAFSLSC
jgi:hypothetical protein